MNSQNLKQLFSFAIFGITCCTQFDADIFDERCDSDFPHTNCLQVWFFQQKVYHFKILPTSIRIYHFKLLLSFGIFFKILPYVHSMWRTYSMKKGFSSVSFASFFRKKIVRSIYNVTMSHIFFYLDLQLQCDNFLVLTVTRRGVIRIYCRGKK